MIHCIGDSHVSVFTGHDCMPPIWHAKNISDDKTKYFKTYRLGAATSYQLDGKIPMIEYIIKESPIVKEDDSMLFCFGEVDIRAHLIKQAEIQEKEIDEIVKECVDKYINTILYFKNDGYNMMVWGPIASWSDNAPYTSGPSFGSNLERNHATKLYNEHLEKLCNENDITFLSIFDKMLLENGITNEKYLDPWLDCHIHLIQTAYPLVMDEFKKKKVI